MNPSSARSILHEIVLHLPKHHWWSLLPNRQSTTTIATVFGIPEIDIEALLVFANVCRFSNRWQRASLHQNGWELFCNTLNDDNAFKHGDYYGVAYIAVDPTYLNPEEQINARARCPLKVTLPNNIVSKIKIMSDQYNTPAITQQPLLPKQEQVCEVTPPQKKQKPESKVGISYPVISKLFDSFEGNPTDNIDHLQRFTSTIVQELNSLHHSMKSTVHIKILSNNDDITVSSAKCSNGIILLQLGYQTTTTIPSLASSRKETTDKETKA